MKDQTMHQVNIEIGKGYKTIVDAVNRIKFHHLVAVLYAVIALVLHLATNQAAMGWFKRTYGLNSEFLSVLFAASAVIVAYNPPRRYFIATLAPLVIYLCIFAMYSAQTGLFSLSALWYITAIIAFVYTLQHKTLGKLRLYHLYSFFMMMIGIAIFNLPERGIAFWIDSRYGIPGETMALALIAGSLWLSFNPNVRAFNIAVAPFVLYVATSLVYSLTNSASGYMGIATASLMMVCILWTYRHLNKYFEVH